MSERNASKKLEKYRVARAEVLRKMYEEMEPEYERICIYADPVDGRKNMYETQEIGEAESPFDDPNLEEKMPNFEDFLN